MIISKAKFNKYLSAIQQAFIIEDKNNKAIRFIIDGNAELNNNIYIKNKFISISLALLKELCNDTEDWIECFIFEKHFGKRKDLIVKIQEEEYKLETIEDLYNLLLIRYNQIKQ
jgi:uncharacterized pyridoxamine 5'-phosphate oxidase family protein